jgi:mono/diheme cytochrome c family protein
MDCGGCHTPGALLGKPDFSRRLAGSDIGFGVPGVGVVYPPNLTADRDTGLGKWTDEEIARAIRHGIRRDGRQLVPIMPWPSYSALTDGDAAALVAYLRQLTPVRNDTPAFARDGQKPSAPYLTVVKPN